MKNSSTDIFREWLKKLYSEVKGIEDSLDRYENLYFVTDDSEIQFRHKFAKEYTELFAKASHLNTFLSNYLDVEEMDREEADSFLMKMV